MYVGRIDSEYQTALLMGRTSVLPVPTFAVRPDFWGIATPDLRTYARG
jgi:hypothetical protein